MHDRFKALLRKLWAKETYKECTVPASQIVMPLIITVIIKLECVLADIYQFPHANKKY